MALFVFIYLSFSSSILNICNAFWLFGCILHCAVEWIYFLMWFIFSISVSWSWSWLKKDKFGDQTLLWSSSFWNNWLLTCSPIRLGAVPIHKPLYGQVLRRTKGPCHVNIRYSSVPWKESQIQVLLQTLVSIQNYCTNVHGKQRHRKCKNRNDSFSDTNKYFSGEGEMLHVA